MEGDDEDSFVSLAALTANVVRYLELTQKKEGERNEGDAGKQRDQIALEQRKLGLK